MLSALWKTLSVQTYDWGKFVILMIDVFLEANGIYHFGAYAIGKEEIEASSQRHKVTLRIKEEWSDEVTTNLYTAVSWKEYFLEKARYSYFYLNPEIA